MIENFFLEIVSYHGEQLDKNTALKGGIKSLHVDLHGKTGWAGIQYIFWSD